MKKKILIIEDSVFQAKALSMTLTELGYEISISNDGKDALEMTKKERPDLIILDFGLPDILLGPQVAATLAEDSDTAEIPIIFLSAMFSKEDEVNSDGSSSGHVMLAKPWDDQELKETIECLLSKATSNETNVKTTSPF